MKRSEFIEGIKTSLNHQISIEQAEQLMDYIEEYMMPKQRIELDVIEGFDNGWD